MSLTIEKLSKRKGNNWVLRDLSIEIRAGEIFGFVGTDEEYLDGVLRIIAGLESADSGKITLDGKPIKKQDVVSYFSYNSVSRWQGFFSSQQKENLAISRALAISKALSNLKEVFVVKSPLQSLDPENAKRIAAEIREVTKEQNIYTIVTSNNADEIFQTCDRVGVVHRGEIVQIGTPEEIYKSPENIACATIFGEINLIEAKRITSSKEKIPEFFTIQGEHRISTDNANKKSLGIINQTVSLAVRPENVMISFGASFPEDNLLKATVKKIDFRGPFTIVTLDSNGLELRALVLRVVGLGIGDECMISIPPSRLRILTN